MFSIIDFTAIDYNDSTILYSTFKSKLLLILNLKT